MIRCLRKVIHIPATCSPNVKLGLEQESRGITPTNDIVVPGCMEYLDYKNRLATFDEHRICVGIHARFYTGAMIMMFPPDWRRAAHRRHLELLRHKRTARAMGIDPGEGKSKTAIAVVDEHGLIELWAKETPDTSQIINLVIDFGRRWGVPPEKWFFDRGGGGKQHADRLNNLGFPARTVAFGEAIKLMPKRSITLLHEKIEAMEQKTVFKNRRAEMYGMLMEAMDPAVGTFAIPDNSFGAVYEELDFQLSKIPKKYDGEGKLFLPPKQRKDPESNEETLTEIIGRSPDELDALVLAVWGMKNKATRRLAGAAG